MIVIGVTGPPGSGKTTVCTRMEELGACVISADEIAQELIDDEEITRKLAGILGAQVVVDEKIDRNRVGEIVFSDSNALEMLNSIMHPPLLSEIQKQIEECEAEQLKVAVIDAALILEWEIEKSMDLLVYVHAPESVGVERLLGRPGMTLEKARGILRAQLPASRKREQCDVTIDASDTLDNTIKQVDSLWGRLDQEVRNAGRRQIDD